MSDDEISTQELFPPQKRLAEIRANALIDAKKEFNDNLTLKNNRENNDTLPEISVDKNNDTLPDIEETGEVSTATNTVNNKQIDPKSMKVKELKLQLRKLGLSTTGNKPILVDRLKEKTVGQNYIF